MKLLLFLIALLFSGPLAPAQPTDDPAEAAVDSSPTAEKEPVEMYSLDYDHEANIFYEPGTKNPYTGPVFTVDEEGRKESEGALKDGKEAGFWIVYYANGEKNSEGRYENAREEGLWKYWWENGNLLSVGAYRAGSPVGVWETYFENGKLASKGSYTAGLMDGEWTFYDAETGEARTALFDMGKKIGK